MVLPDATGGTPELLVISALETLKHENCRHVSFGVLPSEDLGDMVGIGSAASWIVKKTYLLIYTFFLNSMVQKSSGKIRSTKRPTLSLV